MCIHNISIQYEDNRYLVTMHLYMMSDYTYIPTTYLVFKATTDLSVGVGSAWPVLAKVKVGR